jgi:hypothetical protein
MEVTKILSRTWQKKMKEKLLMIHLRFAFILRFIYFMLIFLLCAGLVRMFRRGDSTKVDDFIWSEFYIIILLFSYYFYYYFYPCIALVESRRTDGRPWERRSTWISPGPPWRSLSGYPSSMKVTLGQL